MWQRHSMRYAAGRNPGANTYVDPGHFVAACETPTLPIA
jgi:hypothetical protein